MSGGVRHLNNGFAFRKCLHNPKRITIISTIRGRRPCYTKATTETKSTIPCPFCPGNEEYTPPATLVLTVSNNEQTFASEKRSGEVSDWVVRVFPNKYPALTPRSCSNLTYGYHEVLVESRIHNEEDYLKDPRNIYFALKTLRERLATYLLKKRIE